MTGSPPLPLPKTKSPPCIIKFGIIRCIIEFRYVNGLPHSPTGTGFGLNDLPDDASLGGIIVDPLLHNVAKFSHANGAISQYNLMTIRFPHVGGLISIPPHSLFLDSHSMM